MTTNTSDKPTKVLDPGQATAVAEDVLETLDTIGYTPEEAIPGLILLVTLLSEQTSAPEQALDEAAILLSE